MKLTSATTINELLEQYPFLVDFLVSYNPKFGLLRSRAMRATLGRLATLERVSGMGEVPLPALLHDIAKAIGERTGQKVEVEAPSVEAGGDGRQKNVATLKEIIKDLHDGMPVEQAKERFNVLMKEVRPGEIREMEEQLIREGMAVSEITRLCDLHVGVFKNFLDAQGGQDVPPGHPAHTFRAENMALALAANVFGSALKKLGVPPEGAKLAALKPEVATALEELAQVEKHYLRKEHLLFPYLEKRGVSGPPQVMWSIHDEVRASIKAVRAALADGDADAVVENGAALARTVIDMVYKEDKILMPMSLELLAEEDWKAIRASEAEIGYALAQPAAQWPQERSPAATVSAQPQQAAAGDGLVRLDTGVLSVEQINLLLKHLPVDITFVDENAEVKYFSNKADRVFVRTPDIIGRKVQLCHPPKSLHIVNRILQEFRDGTKDVAEFWIPLGDMLVHIRYFAVRDAHGAYKGTLEVTQDVAPLKALEGARRLLDWDNN